MIQLIGEVDRFCLMLIVKGQVVLYHEPNQQATRSKDEPALSAVFSL